MNHRKNPTIVFVRGLPGSGKSYLANKLITKIGSDKALVLDPDATDYHSEEYINHTNALSAEGVDKQLHPYRFLRAQAFEAINDGKIIVWNQPFTNLDTFRKVIAKMKEHAEQNKKTLAMLIVEVDLDVTTAKKRVAARKKSGGHGPSENTFNRFHNDYTSFANENIKTISVNGSDDVAKSVATVMNAIENLS